MRDKLTPKQAMFVIEYLKDLNGTQAAIRAGYSESTAQEIASENLSKPMIKNAIQEQMDARAGRTLVTADWVIDSLREIAQRCMQAKAVLVYDKHLKEYVQAKDEYGNAIWEFDSAGANKAVETMAKHLKLITDKVDLGNADGTNIQFPVMQTVFVKSPDELV